jgi:hypothetical protein
MGQAARRGRLTKRGASLSPQLCPDLGLLNAGLYGSAF